MNLRSSRSIGPKYIRSSSFGKLNDSHGAALLSRDGILYPALPYKEGKSIHPPVTEFGQEDEFRMLLDWCVLNQLKGSWVEGFKRTWTNHIILSYFLEEGEFPDSEEVSEEAEIPIDPVVIDRMKELYEGESVEKLDKFIQEFYMSALRYENNLINWYVQNFVRVRAGGQYKYQGEELVYFRISSKGFDWTSVIKKFCGEFFGLNSKQYIWVGLDSDNRRSDRRYYEGTVQDLLSENLEHGVWASSKSWK